MTRSLDKLRLVEARLSDHTHLALHRTSILPSDYISATGVMAIKTYLILDIQPTSNLRHIYTYICRQCNTLGDVIRPCEYLSRSSDASRSNFKSERDTNVKKKG